MPTLDAVSRTAHRATLVLAFGFLALLALRIDLGRWSEPSADLLDSAPGMSWLGASLFLGAVVSACLWKGTDALALRHR